MIHRYVETGGFCVLKDEFMTQVEVGGRKKVEDKQCKFLMDLDCHFYNFGKLLL